MRAVVTGAAGFIGYHVCQRLLRDGHEVVGVDNLETGQQRNVDDLTKLARFSFVQHNIIEPLDIDGAVDRVFNLACPASPVDFEPRAVFILRTCSEGVRHMLDLAFHKGARFMHASTSECYGDPHEHPQRETYYGHVNPIGPRSPYDEGKRFAEAMVMAHHRTHGTAVGIVRIFNTYGPRMRGNDGRILPNFIRQALHGEPLTVYGDGSQTRSFCYVDDLVEGIVRRPECDFVEPINLGNPIEVTVREVAEEVIELTGSRSRIEVRPLPGDDPRKRRPDITRAREKLGWEPTVPRRDGFLRTIEYFRSVEL
ncbi:MAG: SDR family oxidoreductase [Phycisphaerae bacterium]|nr:SDR family oxidoreductase [Phycisphaerae bacterium]